MNNIVKYIFFIFLFTMVILNINDYSENRKLLKYVKKLNSSEIDFIKIFDCSNMSKKCLNKKDFILKVENKKDINNILSIFRDIEWKDKHNSSGVNHKYNFEIYFKDYTQMLLIIEDNGYITVLKKHYKHYRYPSNFYLYSKNIVNILKNLKLLSNYWYLNYFDKF